MINNGQSTLLLHCCEDVKSTVPLTMMSSVEFRWQSSTHQGFEGHVQTLFFVIL